MLKKINTIYHSIMEEATAVSQIEKDLLRDYVRQFYDALTEEHEEYEQTQEKSHVKISTISPKVSQLTPTFESPIPIDDPSDENQENKEGQPSLTEETTAHSIPDDQLNPESVEAISDTHASKENAMAKNGKSAEEGFIHHAFSALSTETSSHIGERLASDLKKSLGLNDKLYFANQLFSGDQSRLLESLDRLNEIEDLNDGYADLNQLVEEFGWTDENKQEAVQKFLKLVHRKFQHN